MHLKNLLSRIAPFLSVLILLFLFLQGIQRHSQKSDFKDYYNASILYTEQKDIYQVEILKQLKNTIPPEDIFKEDNFTKLEQLKGTVGTYLYPPTFAYMLIPITSNLSYSNSALLFFIINFIALLGSLYLCYKIAHPQNVFLVLFFTLLMSYRYLESHVHNNQIAFALIFLSLMAIYTKNDILSATLLSLAIIIKLTPAIFVLYFFFQKRYWTIFYTILGLIAWTSLPFLSGGYEYNLQLLSTWYEFVLENAVKNPIFRAWKNNQSLIGTLAKYFANGADPMNQYLLNMPFFVWQLSTIKLINLIITVGLILSLLWKWWTSYSSNQMIGLLFILSVVLSGISWVHSFSVLLFPIYYLTLKIIENPDLKKERWQLIGFGLANIVLGRQFIGIYLEDILLMLSIFLYTTMFLYWTTFKLKLN